MNYLIDLTVLSSIIAIVSLIIVFIGVFMGINDDRFNRIAALTFYSGVVGVILFGFWLAAKLYVRVMT